MDLNQVINDLREKLAKAESERDALAAQVAALKNALSKCRFDSLNQSVSEWAEIQATFEFTPQHHLASHDAEVAKAAFKAGWLCRADRRSFKFEEEAENYAAQLRAKAKP